MYYQNILITPDVFDFVSKYFSGENTDEDIDFRAYKKNLELKCLILDKESSKYNLYEELKNIIENSTSLGKNKLEIIINSFLENNRVKFISLNKVKKIVSNKNHNYLFNLAQSSKTKIINSEKDLILYKNQVSDYEIVNINTFINPSDDSELYNLNRNINLKKGDKYNLYKKLKYYWINTESLRIEDDYLRKKDSTFHGEARDGQFTKLIKLISSCTNLKNLTIYTSFDNKNQSGDCYDEKSFKKEIIRRTKLTPIIKNKKMGERHYYTDKFDIHLGKGLDFFNINEEYRVWRPKVTISITPLENNY